jgi:hypothetical protein
MKSPVSLLKVALRLFTHVLRHVEIRFMNTETSTVMRARDAFICGILTSKRIPPWIYPLHQRNLKNSFSGKLTHRRKVVCLEEQTFLKRITAGKGKVNLSL